MQTTKLSQAERVAFATALKAIKSFDRMDDVLIAIQDLDTSSDIRMADLPKAIPEVVRKQLVWLSNERAKSEKAIEDILGYLEPIAEAEYDRRSEIEEAKKPHCDKCGQVLKAKKAKR